MLLFSGNLSGAAKSNVAKRSSHDGPSNASAAKSSDQEQQPSTTTMLTPHTDVLHRLTNHELRLLEELDRTRAKLQAEWRLKVADFQRQHPSADTCSMANNVLQDVMHSKTMALSPNQVSKSVLRHKKSRLHEESKNGESPVVKIRSQFDILPILTTTGDTPFEIGLEQSGLSQHSPQHVLPIFRLPTVNVAGKAAQLAAKEVEVLEEDRERKQASETLGFSLEEIAMLEAQLQGENSGDGHPTNQYSSFQLLEKQKLPGLHQQRSKPNKQKRSKKTGWKTLSNKDVRLQRSDSLRKELEAALYNVQHLTRLVKYDISSAQRICPASELRTSGIALSKWKQMVALEKQQEKMQAYLMYKGSKKLDLFLLNWSQRKLRQGWTKWWSDIVHARALERSALELDATRVLQRSWRGYRARRFAYLIKMQKLFARQTIAATKIQRLFRGSVTRKFFRLKQLHRRREAAATRIQAIARGYITRRQARELKQLRKMHIAASKIQALYRRRKARREYAILRRNQRLTKAATLIQQRYRGRLGRAKFLRKRIERYREAAAIKIQAMARARHARRILKELKEEDKKRRALRHVSAIQIQRIYRGHRARLSTELKLIALREKNKWRAKTATKIQKVVRCRQAKHKVAQLRQEHFLHLVQLARTWVEFWNEDSAMWFYYNQKSGEALWAPPSTGYMKADGNLVLQNGKVIPDPADGDLSGMLAKRMNPAQLKAPNGSTTNEDKKQQAEEEEEEEEDDDVDRLCIECEEEDARRKCDQCEDVFCDACYEKLHHSSKREKHTWKAIGSMRCIECEKMKATRWCYVCQDPYCLGCYTIIHSKGNKASHEWTDMATFKKTQQQHQHVEEENTQTYDEFMRSSEYQYITELAADEAATTWNTEAEQWMTFIDETTGQMYYYNSATGESKWA